MYNNDYIATNSRSYIYGIVTYGWALRQNRVSLSNEASCCNQSVECLHLYWCASLSGVIAVFWLLLLLCLADSGSRLTARWAVSCSMTSKLVFDRRLMDVYLHQHISPDIDMMANSLARVLIVNMLNGIPTKHNKVLFSFYIFIVLSLTCNRQHLSNDDCLKDKRN